MGLKIIITGAKSIDKFEIAKKLVELNDNLSIAPTFTSDKEYEKIISDNFMYYMSSEEVDLAFKNNVVLYINTVLNISHGITLDSFYNNDIFVMDIEDFNNISDHNITNKDLLVVWVDSKHYDNHDDKKNDLIEAKYLEERLETMPYLYFLDSGEEEIATVINDYLNADDEKKIAICLENC